LAESNFAEIKAKKKRLNELMSDINKDLKNNLYGAMLKNIDCRVLLDDRRTRNMKNENIY
jgi:hypothetical protein